MHCLFFSLLLVLLQSVSSYVLAAVFVRQSSSSWRDVASRCACWESSQSTILGADLALNEFFPLSNTSGNEYIAMTNMPPGGGYGGDHNLSDLSSGAVSKRAFVSTLPELTKNPPAALPLRPYRL